MQSAPCELAVLHASYADNSAPTYSAPTLSRRRRVAALSTWLRTQALQGVRAPTAMQQLQLAL